MSAKQVFCRWLRLTEQNCKHLPKKYFDSNNNRYKNNFGLCVMCVLAKLLGDCQSGIGSLRIASDRTTTSSSLRLCWLCTAHAKGAGDPSADRDRDGATDGTSRASTSHKFATIS